ncbi:unnamed protein product [Brassicogethes aeneus]|uniref:Vacuolar protein sorting-associated protein 13 second N-terminal domain-containing protein n=1 Tax=Brassicogethes aeneus TaxID=1431903 RepID=A0A9P0B836_BRAAE|nr:unnamed protein product [Brassicogethes aeneus]
MDYIIQDLNAYISKDQYKSFLVVSNSLERMNTSWQFLSLRPKEKILENKRKWWKYAYLALLEQRVKPYSWSRIKKVRKNFKQYVETYKNIVLKPNNTEPNNVTNTFKASIKIEGLIMEGANAEELLSPIVSSEHLSDSPAYFFKAELEKMPENSLSPYKLGVVMDSVEILYNKQSLTEITKFFDLQIDTPTFLYNFVETRPSKIENFCRNKLEERWDLSLNIKVPYVVIPESGCFLK